MTERTVVAGRCPPVVPVLTAPGIESSHWSLCEGDILEMTGMAAEKR